MNVKTPQAAKIKLIKLSRACSDFALLEEWLNPGSLPKVGERLIEVKLLQIKTKMQVRESSDMNFSKLVQSN